MLPMPLSTPIAAGIATTEKGQDRDEAENTTSYGRTAGSISDLRENVDRYWIVHRAGRPTTSRKRYL